MREMDTQSELDQWEALDLCDSELPSLLLPCKRKSPSKSLRPNPKPGFDTDTNSLPTLRRCFKPQEDRLVEESEPCPLIPGPAGTVQVAIRRKMSKDPKSFDELGEPIPTQEFIRKAAEEPDWEDKDFSEMPWLSAVDYIPSQGTPVSEIKSVCGSWVKVDQVVAIIKTCTPNGLGDVMVTLKDPTGTIEASVHRNVVSESEFGRDIRVGAVLILNKVAVCAPSRSSRYLNITLKNISKVITKDGPMLRKQNQFEISAKNLVPMNDNEEHLRMQPKAIPVEQGTTQGIMNNLRRSTKESSESIIDVEMEESSLWLTDAAKSHCEITKEQSLLGSQTDTTPSRTASSIQEQQPCDDVAVETGSNNGFRPVKQMSRSRVPNNGELESVMENSDEVTFGSKVNKSQPATSSSSVPQWTDEQLEELFAFD